MPREDSLSSRFDYLFEPLDDEEAADDAIDVPLEPAALSTAVPGIPSQAVSVLPQQTTGIPSEAQQNIGPGPWQQPAPPSQRPSPTSQREPETGVTNSPTTRAPISVAPETRPPFPNQGPGGGGGPESGGGGILGGLPGPDLPGPL